MSIINALVKVAGLAEVVGLAPPQCLTIRVGSFEDLLRWQLAMQRELATLHPNGELPPMPLAYPTNTNLCVMRVRIAGMDVEIIAKTNGKA